MRGLCRLLLPGLLLISNFGFEGKEVLVLGDWLFPGVILHIGIFEC